MSFLVLAKDAKLKTRGAEAVAAAVAEAEAEAGAKADLFSIMRGIEQRIQHLLTSYIQYFCINQSQPEESKPTLLSRKRLTA